MRRKLLIVLVLAGVCFALAPAPAHALDLFAPLKSAAIWVIDLLGSALQAVAGFFLNLAGGLIDAALKMNVDHLSGGVNSIIEANKVVGIGWSIIRDLANLGFVLALIIIAFATILRFQNYSAGRLLPKLIAAAILVNFSLAIVSPFLTLSDTITNVFMKNSQNTPISSVIAGAFGPQNFTVGAGFPGGDISDQKTIAGELSSLAFSVVMILITAVVFFAMAFMLLVRYVYLSVLLTISPIVWLLWVIPGLEHHFKTWWDKFIQWTLFLPVMSFFVYVSVQAAQALAASNLISNLATTTTKDVWQGLLVNGAQTVIVAGLMLGGLIAAQSMGIAGASAAMGIARNAGNLAKRGIVGGAAGVGKLGLKAGMLPVRGVAAGGRSLGQRLMTAGAKTNEKGETTSLMQRAVRLGSRIPGLRGVAASTNARIESALQERGKAVDEKVESYKKLTKGQVEKMVGGIGGIARPMTNEEVVARFIAALEKGVDIETVMGKNRSDLALQRVRELHKQKDVTKTRPDLAKQLGGDIRKVMAKVTAKQAAEDIKKDAYKNENVTLMLEPAHIRQIGNVSSPEVKTTIAETVSQLIGKRDAMPPLDQRRFDRMLERIEIDVNWQPYITWTQTHRPREMGEQQNQTV